ncbi:MAG: hypothetical protein IJA33_03490 [Oscillospiraceae bacterium]|nr:hypothetical protein [Oscillospiraceae bacterium]
MKDNKHGGHRLEKTARRELLPLVIIFAILAAISLSSLILPDRQFSPNENRYLEQRPQFTLQNLFSGKYTAAAAEYTADQIVLRDFWMETASTTQQAMGKQEINNTWLGADGHYFAKVTPDTFDGKQYRKNLQQVEKFFETNADKSCHLLMAPTPAYMLSELLPQNAQLFDADSCFDAMTDQFGSRFIDTRRVLTDPSCYYRTDHHWTTEGALAAYGVWCEATDHEVRNWTLEQVSDSFRGTLYSQVMLPSSAYDSLSIAPDVEVTSVNSDGEMSDSIYSMEALEEKDHYKIFMGGNYAKVIITTGADTGRDLLLIKDSFANSFVPFLTEDYDTITLLDLRHCREEVQAIADGCTDVLVLYELTNFASDNNLFKLN